MPSNNQEERAAEIQLIILLIDRIFPCDPDQTEVKKQTLYHLREER